MLKIEIAQGQCETFHLKQKQSLDQRKSCSEENGKQNTLNYVEMSIFYVFLLT